MRFKKIIQNTVMENGVTVRSIIKIKMPKHLPDDWNQRAFIAGQQANRMTYQDLRLFTQAFLAGNEQ